MPRSGSPAFGSPIRLEAGRAEEEEEFAAVHGTLEVEIKPGVDETVKKEKRKAKAKEQRESGSEKDGMVEIAVRPKEKKRPREEDVSEKSKSKQKDVSASRTALQPIDNNGTPTKFYADRPIITLLQFMNKPSLPRSSQLDRIDSSFVLLPHQVILMTLQAQLLRIAPKLMDQAVVENEEPEKA